MRQNSIPFLTTNGFEVLIDSEDLETLSAYRWYATPLGRNQTRYARARINGERVWMHRFLMLALPSEEIDHINGNGLDNRKANLRRCSHKENCQNNHRRLSKYGYRGIAFNGVNYRAYIKVDGKNLHLGTAPTPEEAAKLYDSAAKNYFGVFANLNFKENTNDR